MGAAMNWKRLYDELSSITAATAQAPGYTLNTVLIDPIALARAWLMGKDREWRQENAALVLAPDKIPSARIAEGHMPFEHGICHIDLEHRRSAIELMPPFLSPASVRETTGLATTMPAFGPLGDQRFTGLHEIGHWLSAQARLDPIPLNSPGRKLRSEALADGFAVAWAAAHGADPAALVRDVGLMRAAGAVTEFDPSYLTFSILEPAAEIGRMAGRSTSVNPWSLIDAVHGACARHLPPREFIDELHGLSLGDLTGTDEKTELRRTIDKHLASQQSWKRADETEWWSRLCLANPEDAGVIRRAPVATTIAIASHKKFLASVDEPMNARLILKRLIPVAALDGAVKMRALSKAIPSTCDRNSCAAAFAEATGIFDGPLDGIIRDGLATLSTHAAQSRVEPDAPAPTPKGLSRVPASFVLIDARDRQMDRNGLGDIAEQLSGAEIKAIAVVHNNCERAEDIARTLRIASDHLGAGIYGFDSETLASKMPSIKASVRQGKTSIIGAMPEFAREQIQR